MNKKTGGCQFLIFWMSSLVLAVAVQAEIVWINDWDSPTEQKTWADRVTTIPQDNEGYVFHQDFDGNGSYGNPTLSGRGAWTWGVQ